MTDVTYDDDLTAIDGRENLWRAVLGLAVDDALFGVSSGDKAATRIRLTQQARNYFLTSNKDFVEVCNLAGLDPEAVHECMTRQIATAPTPEELVATTKRPNPVRRYARSNNGAIAP